MIGCLWRQRTILRCPSSGMLTESKLFQVTNVLFSRAPCNNIHGVQCTFRFTVYNIHSALRCTMHIPLYGVQCTFRFTVYNAHCLESLKVLVYRLKIGMHYFISYFPLVMLLIIFLNLGTTYGGCDPYCHHIAYTCFRLDTHPLSSLRPVCYSVNRHSYIYLYM